MAVNTLGDLLAVHVIPANERERVQVGELAQQVQAVTGETVSIVFADQSYTGQDPAQAARVQGIDLHVVKLPEAKKGFVLLPRRWVVEPSFSWLNRIRQLTRDYERLPETLAGTALRCICDAYADRYAVRGKFITRSSDLQVDILAKGRIDAGLVIETMPPRNAADLPYFGVAREPLVLATPRMPRCRARTARSRSSN